MRLTADLRMYRHSGIGRYLRNLFPLLLPRLTANHIRVLGTVELFGEEEWLRDPRVEIFPTNARIYSVAEQLLGARGAYRDTDLLWVPHYNGPLRYRGKMIATIHDIAPIALPAILDSALKRAYAGLLIRRTVAQASTVLCVSEFTRSEVEYRLHAAAAKLRVTPLGIDADWPENIAAHEEQDGVPYLLFVGNIKPNKNLRLLLEAFALVMEALPHRLVIVGKAHGFTTGDGRALKGITNLGDRVRFAGELSDAALQQLYAGATALVVPSLYEGFGLTLLEAMRLGCPVISSTAGSLEEVGGNAALYFDPHSVDELKTCLLQVTNAETMEQLSRFGRERLAYFSFERCAEETAKAMNSLMQAIT